MFVRTQPLSDSTGEEVPGQTESVTEVNETVEDQAAQADGKDKVDSPSPSPNPDSQNEEQEDNPAPRHEEAEDSFEPPQQAVRVREDGSYLSELVVGEAADERRLADLGVADDDHRTLHPRSHRNRHR